MTSKQRNARRRSRKRVPTGTRTVKEVRQILTTGTTADIAALIPPQPDTGHITLDAPEEVVTQFADRTVEAAIAFVKKAHITQFIDDERDGIKIKPGRPVETLSTRAILVAMRLATRDSRPLLLTEFRTILFRRLSPTMQSILGIPDDPYPDGQADRLLWTERNDARVKRAFHRVLLPLDPSVMPKNRVISADEAERLKRDLTEDQQRKRAADLDWVTGQLHEAAYQQLPQRVRDRVAAQTAAYCIDGTPLPLFARGQGLDKKVISADPDGGWYVRTGDHGDPDEKKKKKKTKSSTKKRSGKDKFKRTTDKFVWAREIHLITLSDVSHPTRLYLPGGLPFASTTEVAARDPAGAARRLFQNLKARGHKPGWLSGDILYTNQDEVKFQTPARDEGFDLVLGYGVNQLGDQGAHHSGARLIDGMYVAPCVPEDLVTIHADLREKRITLAEFKARIQARVEYRMRTKEIAKKEDPETGRRPVKERLGCPASGNNPTAMCALKPKSLAPRPTTQPDGAVVDVRRQIDHSKVLTAGHAPSVCSQETITITPADGASSASPFSSAATNTPPSTTAAANPKKACTAPPRTRPGSRSPTPDADAYAAGQPNNSSPRSSSPRPRRDASSGSSATPRPTATATSTSTVASTWMTTATPSRAPPAAHPERHRSRSPATHPRPHSPADIHRAQSAPCFSHP